MTWTWREKTISNAGELFNAANACHTQDDADDFLTAYRAVSEHADANLGYVIGYGDAATRKRLYDLFRLGHPVYGRAV